MATLNLTQVLGETGRESSAGVVDITNNPLGNVDATNEWFAFRFQNVTIAPGSTINTAVMSIVVPLSTEDEPLHTFYGEDHDNAPVLTNAASSISTRTQTTATVLWDNTNLGAPGTFSPPGMAAIVQEIIDRPGWASGNAIVIFCNGSATATRDLSVNNGDATFAIDYTPPVETYRAAPRISQPQQAPRRAASSAYWRQNAAVIEEAVVDTYIPPGAVGGVA
jgi:hypothetical protein